MRNLVLLVLLTSVMLYSEQTQWETSDINVEDIKLLHYVIMDEGVERDFYSFNSDVDKILQEENIRFGEQDFYSIRYEDGTYYIKIFRRHVEEEGKKMRIKEVIVVEGKDDISAVKRAVEAEIITTSGMGISEATLKKIEGANKRSGIVILTDPDYPGERIRSIVSQRVGNCKQAYLTKKQARCPATGKIGVEYASPEAIREALLRAKVEQNTSEDLYSIEDLYTWGLTGSIFGRRRRAQLGEILGIGNTNAKQFLKRLNSFGIPREEIQKALMKLEGPDQK